MKTKIYTTLKNGKIKDYDVIATFKNEENKKDYVVYTDNTYDSDKKLKVYAATYNPLTNEFIDTVKTKEEWIEITKVLDNLV